MSLFGNKESVKGKKSLVIYFSRVDENYAVGNIEKGNTEVIAEYIRDITGADLFKVEPVKPYSKNYKECCDEALEEKRQDARPELKNYLEDISEYEVIYIGSPIYWRNHANEYVYTIGKVRFHREDDKSVYNTRRLWAWNSSI